MKSFKFSVKNERFAYICLHAKLIVNLVILQCCFAKYYIKKKKPLKFVPATSGVRCAAPLLPKHLLYVLDLSFLIR